MCGRMYTNALVDSNREKKGAFCLSSPTISSLLPRLTFTRPSLCTKHTYSESLLLFREAQGGSGFSPARHMYRPGRGGVVLIILQRCLMSSHLFRAGILPTLGCAVTPFQTSPAVEYGKLPLWCKQPYYRIES